MELIQQIAGALHTAWIANHMIGQTDFEVVKDKKFIKSIKKPYPNTIRVSEDGVVQIDIANTPFDNLSNDWKTENLAAARVIVRLLKSKKTHSKNEIGTIIHKKWLKRHPWAKKDKILSKPFVELPISEQKKDLKQYEIGLAIYHAQKNKY